MDELHNILATHLSKADSRRKKDPPGKKTPVPTVSKIPDLLWDEVLVSNKLSRVEIMVLMYLYRVVWCRPNLYQKYGISPVLSLSSMTDELSLEYEIVYNAINKLESFGFIETIRAGQYFVRKYFTQENDGKYEQFYDDF